MLGFALDLTGTQRTLELNTAYAAVEPLPTDNLVPFTEQVSLGGSYPMRAFTGGRLIDESAIVSTISYNWPLLPDLDGSLHYSVGNVFANHLSDFDVGHLRSSFGIGMETVSSLDYPFEILVALGTKPFEEGGDIDTVRFVMGTSAGF
jgi:outer membrane protein assembly factor BamA